jgi:hypothetical protein
MRSNPTVELAAKERKEHIETVQPLRSSMATPLDTISQRRSWRNAAYSIEPMVDWVWYKPKD